MAETIFLIVMFVLLAVAFVFVLPALLVMKRNPGILVGGCHPPLPPRVPRVKKTARKPRQRKPRKDQ